ncbi:MAG: dihydroneopterin aldolase [Actinobacteria bacterium]|nr:dihydroneopterin aldolase [Actinomycetota bacterium]
MMRPADGPPTTSPPADRSLAATSGSAPVLVGPPAHTASRLAVTGTTIAIDGIRVLGRHGLTPEERERAQPFEIDMLVELSGSNAYSTDDISDTLDYGAIVALAVEVLEGPPHKLLELLAGSIVKRIRNEYGDKVGYVAVTVRKLHPPIEYHVGGVGVTVEMPGERR